MTVLWPVAMCFAFPTVVLAEAGPDQDIVILEDDDEIVIDEGEDDLVIVEPGDEPSTKSEPEVSGALGRLWETWHAQLDAGVISQVQPLTADLFRTRATARATASLLPARNLKFFGDAIARGTFDTSGAEGRFGGYVDLYEAWAKVNAQVGSVQLGRVVVPWGRTAVAALGDRLNPPDHRRGPSFEEPALSRQPQLGVVVRTSLGGLGVEAAALVLHEPSEGSLGAADQGGVRAARYQGALVRDAGRFAELELGSREGLLGTANFFDAMSVGVRVTRRIGDLDIGASAVLAPDPTPRFELDPEFARHLAEDATDRDPSTPSCSLECAGRIGRIVHDPAASLTADAALGLGIIILKAEVLAQPKAGVFTGKTATLIAPEVGIQSTRLSQYAAALAVEGAIGDAVSGSIEVFDVWWTQVPAGVNLWGVEPLAASTAVARDVHRVAIGASLSGAFMAERLQWLLRGEGGVSQPDVLLTARLRYRLPLGNLYVGGQGNLFTGVAGSPGWLRQDASTFGLFVGEGA